MNTHILGSQGEHIAKLFLEKKKYKILEVNYKNPIGEIDLICKDKNTYVFVEVKTRTSARFGLPREAVTLYKQEKIKKVALGYLKFHKLMDEKVRFDCVEILGDTIEHIENCF